MFTGNKLFPKRLYKLSGASIPLVEVVSVLVFLSVVLYKSFICEDAFINLVELNNFNHGFFLSSIPNVRTQSATSPLWLICELLIWKLFSSSLNSIIFLSIVLSVSSVVLGIYFIRKNFPSAQPWIFVLMLTASTVYSDYSTSGLENPLEHLLIVILIISLFDFAKKSDNRKFKNILFVSSLIILTRFDLFLIVLPILFFAFVKIRKSLSLGKILSLALPLSPILIWLIFTISYYGEVFPETYFAKVGEGVPLFERIPFAVLHNLRLLDFDPLGVAIICVFLFTVSFRFLMSRLQGTRKIDEIVWMFPVAVGIMFYQIYFYWIGGDYMIGRFDSITIVASALFIPFLLKSPQGGAFNFPLAGLFAVGIYGCLPLHVFVPGHDPISDSTIVRAATFDIRLFPENWYFLKQNHSLVDWKDSGLQKAVAADSMKNLDPYIAISAGIIPYYAGPKSRLIDELGITDPLIARLPCHSIFAPGHCRRVVPSGYLSFIAHGSPLSMDPKLAAYVELLYAAKTGKVWSFSQFVRALEFTFGKGKSSLDRYIAGHKQISYQHGSDQTLIKSLFNQTILG